MQLSERAVYTVLLTCRIKSIESRYSVTVEHPEMAIVAREQAGFTGSYHMIAYNVTAGSRTEGEQRGNTVSTFPGDTSEKC